MPDYRVTIRIPRWIDRLVVWPVLVWRWFWYDHSYRRVKLIGGKYAKVESRDFEEVSKFIWRARKTPRSHTAVRFIEKGRVLVPVHMHREIFFGTNPKSESVIPKPVLRPKDGTTEGRQIQNPNDGNSKRKRTTIFVDHINRDALDNRRANLRLATESQNCMNRRKCKGTSSQYKGVSIDRRKKLWKAAIKIDEKNSHLGYFESEIEAARAYDAAARKYHGEYAYQNFEDEYRKLTWRERIRKIIKGAAGYLRTTSRRDSAGNIEKENRGQCPRLN